MRQWVLLCLAGIATASSFASASVLVNEQFNDNERLTQNAPDSLQWTYGAHRETNAFASLDASSGKLVLDHTNPSENSFAGIWTYFTPSGSPQTVAVGQTLELTFDVSVRGGVFSSSVGGFRFALFDSSSSRVTTDFASRNESGLSSGNTFKVYKGYEGQLPVNSGSSSNNFYTRERTGSGTGLYTSTNNWSTLSGSNTTAPAFAASTTYAGRLTLTRTAVGMEIQAQMGANTTHLVTDTTPFTTFDTVSFFVLDAMTHDLTLDNIRVTLIPEPASAGLAGMILVPLLRSRRRRS